MKIRTIFVVSALLTVSLALAACSNGSPTDSAENASPSPSVSSEFNDADVTFARMMIPHHAQAIEMSDIILAKEDVDPRVTELAEEIKGAQQPEIDQLNNMLEAWGEPVSPDMGHGDMDHGSMDGMMSDDDMAALESAAGPDASRLFLEQMIAHHEGAVDMAQEEIASGSNPEAIAMAEDITATQNSEIDTMREILETL
ncbi:MAG: DUF305 domain-containing protein [Gulosibacter sp.]|uniref:DUF305 domain-containing protein n=1 Tax=Gulosibacter sp. TaxID=2817531 RepID=UPI003F9199EE